MVERKKKVGMALLGVVLFLVIGYLIPVPSALAVATEHTESNGARAMVTLGALILAICWWVGFVLPDWCTALVLQILWVVAGGHAMKDVFAGYVSDTLWLIVGSLMIATAITKTGILGRITKQLMRLFPITFRGQVLALLSVGTICAPLIPTITAKGVLGSKLAQSNADLMGYGTDSRGRCGLFAAAWTGFSLTAPGFLSACFLGYSMLEALPEAYQCDLSWGSWFVLVVPWLVMMLVGMYVSILHLYNPGNHELSVVQITQFTGEADKCVSRNEKITAIIVVCCLVGWVLEWITGVSAGIVALAGGISCFALGVLEDKEIKNISWGFVIFIGVVLNVGAILASVGISEWFVALMSPALSHVSNPYLVVLAVVLITLVLRVLLASQTATIILLTAVLAPVVAQVGIHPVVVGLVVYASSACWYLLYQNPTYLAALQSMDGTIHHKGMANLSWVFLAISTIGFLVCVPYWGLLGYL